MIFSYHQKRSQLLNDQVVPQAEPDKELTQKDYFDVVKTNM